jgi:hypothetical protein
MADEGPPNAMPRSLAEYDGARKLRELAELGWCAFDEAFDRRESRALECMLQSFVDGLAIERLAGFGATIFALAAREPRMREFYRQVPVLPFIARALEAPIAFRRTGARISGRTSHERIVWHHHHGWGAEGLARRTRFERLLFICYLEGTDREHGPLVVRPRAFSDPFEEAPLERFDALAGEVHLEYAPGTIVVMDAPVLHSALRGTGDELRIIWGAHVQSREVPDEHPEDDAVVERARVDLRHRFFRWGLRDGRRWIERANRSALPRTNAY